MGSTGRKGRKISISDEGVVRRIVAAIQQVGMSHDEALNLVGIAPRSFYRWKARALEVSRLLPADWKKATLDQLRDWAEDLEVDLDYVRGTGKGERVVRADVVAALQEAVGHHLELFQQLDTAHLRGEVELIAELERSAKGQVEEIREYQEPRTVERDGEMVTEWVPVRRVVITPRPNEKTQRFLAERRFGRWNRKKPTDSAGQGADPQTLAASIQRALAEMDQLVPAPEAAPSHEPD